ncbi:MAG: T9SS type A sorting domain-containing protein [Candidatus Syntrophosphaera sp.]|nr:T9SS type A sorting domain-containing protein [Candidatus Syntrophosphaera sp.]
MKKAALTILLGILLAMSSALIVETASLRNFLVGNEPNSAYDNWVSHLAEGIASNNYNLYAPYDVQTNGFGDFRLPTILDQVYWNNMLNLFVAEDYEGAQTVLTNAGAPFQVVQFNDTDSGRTYYMIRELPNMTYYDDNGTPDPDDDEIGAFTYGWGLFIYNPQGTKPIIITVPHPCDDFPTPIIGYLALHVWDAKFLLINGSGREVRWTNEGSYTNTKSLSDPTRNALHPLHTAYKKFADKIRDEEGWREFSAQIHSYDWNRHVGYPNNQISAGNPRMCPNLPIRDLSNLKLDLINQGSHVMIPANTVGTHADVYLNDYYSVNYNVHEFIFSDGEHTYPVNDYVDMPAYTQNQQMLYTQSGTTDYDVYEPFFHVEMDELPNSYEETTNAYKWFYGWNEALQKWDMDNLFTHYLDYYERWVYDMEPVLVAMFNLNDGMSPTDPTNLAVLNQSLNNVTLSWERSSDYDFDSYEILYATEPIGFANYQIFDRGNNAFLASQSCQSIEVTGLNNANPYYFKIRARDKNGNYSQLSNEVNTILAPANIYSLRVHGMDNAVRVYWQVNGQTNNQGFSVYRQHNNGAYALLDSWQTNPALINPTGYNFEWWDTNVVNDEFYTYKVSSTNSSNVEFFYNFPATASPRAIHTITISNNSYTLADTISFGINPYATDGSDYYWDVTKGTPGSTYVWNAFWEQYWGSSGTHLSREIKGAFDLDERVKTWVMRTRSDQLNETLTITASDNFDRLEKLYLQDGGNYHNLLSAPYQYTNLNSNIRTMTLFWGNMQPKFLFSGMPNRVYRGGSTVNFYWNYQYPFLIDHVELSIINATDSLMVNEFIPPDQFNYSWFVPATVNDMQDCRLVADVVAVDGVRTRFWSDYRFALVPYMNMAFNEAGWKMRANPWLNTDLSFEDVFGVGAVGYSRNAMGGWAQTADYDFGSAYAVHSPDIAFYSNTNPVQADEYSFGLVTGWNFIPNPHLCAYDIEDISFTLNGTLFRFSEMLAQELVSRAVYVLRGDTYVPVDRVEPFEALLIKFYGPTALNPQIRFYPFFEAQPVMPQAANWDLRIQAGQNDAVSELVLGGHQLASQDYDFRFDLPVPPLPPFDRPALWFTVPDTNPDALENSLYSDFRNDFSSPEQQEFWNFKLQVFSDDPVEFNFEQLNVPDGWQILMLLNDTPHYVLGNGTYDWTPPEAGIYDGYIRVSNYMVGVDDLVQSPISGLIAYPNPFNPDVNIAFNLASSARVKLDIYNIRGQKVKSLMEGTLPGGAHNLKWDGRDQSGRGVASGVYFARVNTKNETQIIKMMLMK